MTIIAHAFVCICLLLLSTGVIGETFFRCEGTNILDPSGEPFVAKGIVLSGWLIPEAYGLRLNDVHSNFLNSHSHIMENVERLLGSTSDADEFWSAFHENYVTANDMQHFSKLGFNAVRVPFNYRLVSPEDTPGEYSEEGFQVLDKVISWSKANGMAVLLDLHACPGGQSHDAYADPEYSYFYSEPDKEAEWKERGVQVMWEANEEYFAQTGRTPEFNKQRTADIWREIASRYKDEKSILGYELANEPYFYESSGVTNEDLRQFFINVTAAVREVDTNHIVFVEGNIFAEMIDGLLPPWDDNMAIAVHRYWRETRYEDGKVQEYLDARQEHNIPFLLTESGENSNPWLYEMRQLMEENNIGWFFWGFKKVNAIATTYNVKISPDYQYVINNWRDSPDVDSSRVRKGLMDLVEALKTENCEYKPGFFEAMVDPMFSTTIRPYTNHNVPGIVHCVNYDIGNQGMAYSDTKYKNVEYQGASWNAGWSYRNDGVDIYPSDDSHESSIGYHVSDTEPGEWLKFTINVSKAAYYRVAFRVAASNSDGELQLMEGATSRTGVVKVQHTGGTWVTQSVDDAIPMSAGVHILELKVLSGGFDIAWMEFEETSAPTSGSGRKMSLSALMWMGVFFPFIVNFIY